MPDLPPPSTRFSSEYQQRNIALGIEGFRFVDLFTASGLTRLHARFLVDIEASHPEVAARLRAYLANPREHDGEAAEVVCTAAPLVATFLARLFGVGATLEDLNASYTATRDLFQFKDTVMRRVHRQRRAGCAKQAFVASRVDNYVRHLAPRLASKLAAAESVSARARPIVHTSTGTKRRRPYEPGAPDPRELAVATAALALADWQAHYDEAAHHDRPVSAATSDAVQAFYVALVRTGEDVPCERPRDDAEERAFVQLAYDEMLAMLTALVDEQSTWPPATRWSSVRVPHKLAFDDLIETAVGPHGGVVAAASRRRDGFALTDNRKRRVDVAAEADYCLLCHPRGKDSCSKGLLDRQTGQPRPHALGVPMTGCPLDEKISEVHTLVRAGDPLAALAVIMIDNPMCPGTGHRICNECMRACVYQKQDPVDIPEVETRVLSDIVYNLPYGAEIYGLLTRWNPLDRRCPVLRDYNGHDVLVVGQGPAGYTLAHYLTKEGFGVVAIDGLAVEPLDEASTGARVGVPEPIVDFAARYVDLDRRVPAGFGGVSEYGITVRWDKNFLDLIQLTLARRSKYRFYDGVRLGGTLTIDDCWAKGFAHIAMATGAGRPTIIPFRNNLVAGIRKASDFLMALQLSGAGLRDGLANLEIALPAVVVGGGLTAVDTATEMAAYYPVMVERVAERYDELVRHGDDALLRESLSPHKRARLDEFVAHGREVRAERRRAAECGEAPALSALVRRWGGVTLVYRKSLLDSPAYRLNHEEVAKALEEGIEFVESCAPVEAVTDASGALAGLVLQVQACDEHGRWRATDATFTLPVRSMCVAAGTSPNTMIEREQPGSFEQTTHGFFAAHRLVRSNDQRRLEAGRGFLTSYQRDGRHVSFYGDNHPDYAGNVVRAMASARDGHRSIVAQFDTPRLDCAEAREREWLQRCERLDDELIAVVQRVERLTPTVVEVVVRAKQAARRFAPGQFYRVQRYRKHAPRIGEVTLATEALALTGAAVDSDEGLLSLIVLEVGHSSRLCATLRPGEPIVCMGPTGTATEIPHNETVLLVGGGLGNAVLFSVAAACRAQGNRVLYFAGYRDAEDMFKVEELRRHSDTLVTCIDAGDLPYVGDRTGDAVFRGNIVEGLVAYAKGELGEPAISLREVDRVVVIGSDRMMNAVKQARHQQLAPYLDASHVAIGSINSPMQCMMKEICAQCLARHVDPETGEESFVFSCVNQDQPLDHVDFDHLAARLGSNAVLERLTDLWLRRRLADAPAVRRV